MNVAIHQPEHLPWLGFFHKMVKSDIFVILDNVQFRKNYYQNRNKVRISTGWSWVAVPITHTLKTLIKDVAISDNPNWKRKWHNMIYLSYKKSPFFDAYYKDIDSALHADCGSLSEFNIILIKLLCKFLNINTRLVYASQIGVSGSGSGLILDICKKLNATIYISGVSGREYLKLDDFVRENIEVIFQEFHHPIYKQLYEPFIPCMSTIDLLFNHGYDSLDIINGKGVPVMERIFL